jgi:hypothetical protein
VSQDLGGLHDSLVGDPDSAENFFESFDEGRHLWVTSRAGEVIRDR